MEPEGYVGLDRLRTMAFRRPSNLELGNRMGQNAIHTLIVTNKPDVAMILYTTSNVAW